jgi:translation initiation factor eIF-2B subunit epsilon
MYHAVSVRGQPAAFVFGCLGSNVVIEGAYIWDDVVIEDNCKVTRSIIANGVKILEGVTIQKGSIISFNVSLKT